MKTQSKKQLVVEEKAERAPKYDKFEPIEFEIKLLSQSLGAAPSVDGDKIVRFERDGDKIVMRAKNYLAVTREALRVSNLGLAKAALRSFFFEDVLLENVKTGQIALPSPPQYPGGRGTGISIYETLEPGTKIKVRATIPTSVITKKKFLEAWQLAGNLVRFSPSKARLGYGRFEVV